MQGGGSILLEWDSFALGGLNSQSNPTTLLPPW